MKLIMCIVDDLDAYSVLDELNKRRIQATRLSSTGGFLRKGNTTLLIGLQEEQVQEVVGVVESLCHPKDQAISMDTMGMLGYDHFNTFPVSITTGGAVIFVMNVENFVKV